MTMLWRRTHARDQAARLLADRHYSRVVVGSPEFAPPGPKVLLVLPHYTALWVTNRATSPAYRADGLDVWYCSLFRNESSRLATVLIRQAIEATRAAWLHVPLPADGFITYINERKIQAPPDGKPYGWTFLEAGFTPIGRTKVRDLLTLQMPRDVLAGVTPRCARWHSGGHQAEMEFSA